MRVGIGEKGRGKKERKKKYGMDIKNTRRNCSSDYWRGGKKCNPFLLATPRLLKKAALRAMETGTLVSTFHDRCFSCDTFGEEAPGLATKWSFDDIIPVLAFKFTFFVFLAF